MIRRRPLLLDDLGLRKAAEGAFIKLLAALPALSRRDAEDIHQRIHIDAAGWDGFDEQAPWLSLLQEAMWQERKLFLSYRRRDESVIECLVDPLGLVAKPTGCATRFNSSVIWLESIFHGSPVFIRQRYF
jgi:predicted DNA-binding transcriptional regulator YafY